MIDIKGEGCSTEKLIESTWMADYYDREHDKPSEYDPGTTVYQLVEELRDYLK